MKMLLTVMVTPTLLSGFIGIASALGLQSVQSPSQEHFHSFAPSALGGKSQTYEEPRLRFKSDQFKISVFQDLHFGEAEDLWWGTAQDVATTEVMDVVLRNELPELVVLNGDLITGENTYLHNSSEWTRRLVQPMVDRQIMWASTYGNHDNQFNLSSRDIKSEEDSYTLSLTSQMVVGDDVGVTNYYLEVFPEETRNRSVSTVPALRLWFFDSRGGTKFQQLDDSGNNVGIPGHVHSTVAEWFRMTSAKLKRDYSTTVPSVAFVHIPPHASKVMQSQGINSRTAPGINDDDPLAAQGEDCSGTDGCTWSGADLDFTRALVETEGLIAVFSGHDHGDDWCANWNSTLPDVGINGQGLNLCFGRHTGYGGYGSWTRGSRQIVFHADNGQVAGVETWNRLESQHDRPANASELANRIWLNETYGSDLYPIVRSTFTRLTNPGREQPTEN